jgi:two-component system, OmpR family, sensor histidine kinase KdpD
VPIAADARRAELELLQQLSQGLVAMQPGPRGYEVVLEELIRQFGFSRASLFVEEGGHLLERATVGGIPGELAPSWDPRLDVAPPERLPLHVGGRNVGLLVLSGDRPPLDPMESRIVRTFCDQLAVILERDRLLELATEAEILRKSDSLRRTLLGAVSHELRSPLAAIKTSVTDLLAEDAHHDPSSVREALESVNEETDRLNALIANLLDASRIEAGVLRANIQNVDLEELLAKSVDRMRRVYREVKVYTTIHAFPLVRADPIFLDRVIGNLLENAARAASKSRRHSVEVVVEARRQSVTTRITDHGVGVPSDVREQLFYPFYKIDERRARLGPGLGLAIVKGFLSLMKGEVWVEDTPGGGATFAFSLPGAGSEGQREMGAAAEAKSGTGS